MLQEAVSTCSWVHIFQPILSLSKTLFYLSFSKNSLTRKISTVKKKKKKKGNSLNDLKKKKLVKHRDKIHIYTWMSLLYKHTFEIRGGLRRIYNIVVQLICTWRNTHTLFIHSFSFLFFLFYCFSNWFRNVDWGYKYSHTFIRDDWKSKTID